MFVKGMLIMLNLRRGKYCSGMQQGNFSLQYLILIISGLENKESASSS